MSHLAPLRDALFGLIQSIDVTPVADEPWQFAFKHPVKQPQGYPGFCVVPARNSTRTIDPITQEGSYVFWVYLFYTFEEAASGEDKLVGMADLVYDRLLEELKSLSPLAGAAFDGDPSGEWGFDAEHGERFYRIEVTARALQELSLDLP